MIRWIRSSPLRFSVLVMALAFLMTTVPAHAKCTALDINGLPRDCTLMEQFGSCLWNAQDSHSQCWTDAGYSGWARFKCDMAHAVDFAGCIATSPLKVLLE